MMSEVSSIPESEIPHKLTDRENAAMEAVESSLFARPEYAEGKEKLDFEYKFSTGEIFRATEDEKGNARLVITRGENVIVNFQDYLPNFTFVTPTAIIKSNPARRIKKDSNGRFCSEPFEINIGDMRDPKSIFALLHEIGHGVNLRKQGKYYKDRDLLEEWARYNGKFQTPYSEERRALAEKISQTERDASATALKIARAIKEEQGVNVLEGFNSFDEVQELISAALVNYRESIGEEMVASDEGFLGNIVARIAQKLWGEGHGTEQWQFVQKLFDKGKLNRRPIKELKREWEG